jgi:hypothetical protein
MFFKKARRPLRMWVALAVIDEVSEGPYRFSPYSPADSLDNKHTSILFSITKV